MVSGEGGESPGVPEDADEPEPLIGAEPAAGQWSANAGGMAPMAPVAARGRRVLLRPVSGADVPVLFRWYSDLRFLHVWSNDRRLYTLETFQAQFRQFVSGAIVVMICDRQGQPIGFARAHHINFTDAWLRLTFFVEDLQERPHEGLEAIALFVDYLFAGFPMRKIYVELPEYDEGTPTLLARLGFSIEGRDRGHLWYGDRWWDMLRLSVFREGWLEARQELLRLAELTAGITAALGPDPEYEARVSL